MNQTAFGYLLKWLREKRNLSLREVGQLADLDHAYIHRLESGAKESPSVETLTRLQRALKPGRRDGDIFRYLADYPNTDEALVVAALNDPSVTLQEFSAVAGMSFRGERPDYVRLLAKVRRIMSMDSGVE